MPREYDPDSIPLTAIHLDLRDRAISFEADGRTLARLRFAGETVLFEGPPRSLPAPPAPPHAEQPLPPHDEPAPAPEQPVTLMAKLLTRPTMRVRPDDGAPVTIASATVAVEEAGRAEPHLYRATFPAELARQVRRLRPESHLILAGYPAASDDPRQPLDGFAVTEIVAAPGKPPKPSRR